MKLPMILASSVIFWFFIGCQKEDRANSMRSQVDWARHNLDAIVELDPEDPADFAWADEIAKDKIAKGEVWYCTH